ncbi:hypothetical protein SS50377_25459 [Spironucleus salmonicida]|uniref:Uncharacterized protein n=1 Tax=Spironucleus salmonicida TaxID=348837 RepID=V6LKB7_9EUKA|nr:hypothetical protein SS50377_25459 [Spironucleus salmonicida]|eukprot:EST45007.1 Hypothetical protein SS50377_15026 [Spironucleus salmonicida]
MSNVQDNSFQDFYQRPYINEPETSLEFKKFKDELYVKVSSLIGTYDSIQLCSEELHSFQSKKFLKGEVKQYTSWDQQQNNKFAIIVQAIGVKSVSPKQILYCMGANTFTRKNIGSRLQKYRLSIVREYQLESTAQIQNWMFPRSTNSQIIMDIVSKWHVVQFDGFSMQDIQQFLLIQ